MQRKKEPRKAEILLEYQNYVEQPSATSPDNMYQMACSSDNITIKSWKQIWIDNVKASHEHFKSFKENSIGKLFGLHKHQPCIIAGSGPSLGVNIDDLKDRGDIPLVSCLHNYHYFEDKGIKVDFYVTLDAGPIVIEEVCEGGSKTEAEYWESTKDKTLIAFIGSHPDLFKKWKGKVYLYNAPVPEHDYMAQIDGIEKFNTYMGTGGNVLGACLYFAKAILGCNPIAFVGADFSFGYNKKFHSWNSKYDAKMGHVLKAVDVYGNKVLTWQSYYNFKNWFEYIAMTVPGIYINCTEGGTFGSYPEGNIMAVRQMRLHEFLNMYLMYEEIRVSCENSEIDERRLLF